MSKVVKNLHSLLSNYKLDPWIGFSKLYTPIWIFFLSFTTDWIFHFPPLSATLFSLLALFYGVTHFFIDSFDKNFPLAARRKAILLLLITYLLFCWGTSLSFLATRFAAVAYLATNSQARIDFAEYGRIHFLNQNKESWALVRDSSLMQISDSANLKNQESCKTHARLVFPEYYLLNIAC